MFNKIALHYILFILQIGRQVNMSPVPNHPTLTTTYTNVPHPETHVPKPKLLSSTVCICKGHKTVYGSKYIRENLTKL